MCRLDSRLLRNRSACRREQKGTIYRKCGVWYLRYSDFRVIDGQLERKRLAKQLGPVAEMTKQKARDEARLFLAAINTPTLQPESAVTLVQFVEKVYFPRIEQRLRPSTVRSYRVEWKAQLKPYCANLWTRDVRTRDAQAILDIMAATDRFNVCSLQRIKSFLSGVFRLAIQQGYYDGSNPMRETSIPAARRSDETYAYSLTEELTMIQAVPEPAATMLAVGAFTGARRGEIRGMAWENYRDGELLIDCSVLERYYDGTEEQEKQGAHSHHRLARRQTVGPPRAERQSHFRPAVPQQCGQPDGP